MQRTTAIADADALARNNEFIYSGVAVKEKGGVQSGAVFCFKSKGVLQ